MKELLHLDKAQELLALCFEYQNKGLGHAFFNVYGHCEQLDVKIHDGAWSMENKPVYTFEVYIRKGQDCGAKLNKAISDIRSLINNAKLFEERQKEIEAANIAAKRKQLEGLSKELNVKIVG